MRKRSIKSVAHWCMMFLLLMFPVLMVGLSVFQNHEETDIQYIYEPVSYDDLVVGETYQINPVNIGTQSSDMGTSAYRCNVVNVRAVNFTTNVDLSSIVSFSLYSSTNGVSYVNFQDINNVGVLSLNSNNNYIIQYQLVSKNLLGTSITLFNLINNNKVTVIDNYNYKLDVNYWVNGFIDLPVNAWYKQLMSYIGIGFTNSSVMNVIYVMPIYIMWVYILDVIVDCFLVIINFGHNALHRLGGDNE